MGFKMGGWSAFTKTIAKDKTFDEEAGKNKIDITEEPRNTPEIEKMLTTYENLENKQNKTQEEINKMKMLKEKLDAFYEDDNPS